MTFGRNPGPPDTHMLALPPCRRSGLASLGRAPVLPSEEQAANHGVRTTGRAHEVRVEWTAVFGPCIQLFVHAVSILLRGWSWPYGARHPRALAPRHTP